MQTLSTFNVDRSLTHQLYTICCTVCKYRVTIVLRDETGIAKYDVLALFDSCLPLVVVVSSNSNRILTHPKYYLSVSLVIPDSIHPFRTKHSFALLRCVLNRYVSQMPSEVEGGAIPEKNRGSWTAFLKVRIVPLIVV